MNDIIEAFISNMEKEFKEVNLFYLLIYILAVCLIVHILVIIYTKNRKKTISIGNEVLLIMVFGYLGIIASLTIFNRQPDSSLRVFLSKHLMWEENINQNITNILNIILYIPFGAMVTAILKRDRSYKRVLMMLCYSFIISLFFECIKYFTNRGYFEVDNIEANIIGAILGGIIVCIISKITNENK